MERTALARIGLGWLLFTMTAFAQTPANETVATFWPKFQSAVVKGDTEAIVGMTKLPFLLDNKNLDRAKFTKVVPELFDAKAKKCFATAKPVKDKDGFEIFCGEQMYVFEKVGTALKFTVIGAND